MDVALREIHHGRVWRANPCRLVGESNSEVALWSPAGITRKLPVDETGREIRIPVADWILGEDVTRHDFLCLHYPRRAYSLWLCWGDGHFEYWYVNLEQPLGRSRVGWDYVDHKLDLIALPDGRVEWKDEDELAQAAAVGLLDEAEIRADAEAVLAARPWPTGWEDWRPDPAWPLPQLPEGWDVV
jgi:predicted RNA-binding protein associated with RNAse of E/G family